MTLPRRSGHHTTAVVIMILTAAVIPSALAFNAPARHASRIHQPHHHDDVSNSLHNRHNLLLNRITLKSSINSDDSHIQEGIRLNKVFKATHSRRAADKLIEEGRVTVNGERVHEKGGFKVVPFRDVVCLDGKVVKGWEQINAISKESNTDKMQQQRGRKTSSDYNLHTSTFEYVKYYKPLGVTCTTDLRVKDNIIDAIHIDGYTSHHRVYPVGRLDKETSGLIILTSDGRIVNAVLRGEKKQPKVYKVKVDGLLEDRHIQRLRVRQERYGYAFF